MSLDKRWIAIVEHPTMPHWDDYPAPGLHKSAQAAALVAVDSKARVCDCDHEHRVRVVEIDVDDALQVEQPLDEQHQHAERMATKWLARYQELSAEVGRVPGTCEATTHGWRVGDLLTVEQWGALNSLLTALANDEPRSVALNDRTAPLVAAAIEKLFAINAGHVVCGYCKPKWGVFDTHVEKS